ncbi:MAG: hypothetical protein WB511_03730, partial [Nitrososphaeraceae archaeon]
MTVKSLIWFHRKLCPDYLANNQLFVHYLLVGTRDDVIGLKKTNSIRCTSCGTMKLDYFFCVPYNA